MYLNYLKDLLNCIISLFIFMIITGCDTIENLNSIYFADIKHGWVVGNNGLIINTTDGGTTCVEQESQTLVDLLSVYFNSNEVGWASGRNGIVLNTLNGGDTWLTNQVGWTSDENLYSILFCNDQIGWVSGGRWTAYMMYGTLYKTTNGGQEWTSLNYIHNNMNPIIDVFFYGINHCWLISNNAYQNNNYARTTDGGATWHYDVLNFRPRSIFFLNENVGWIVGERIVKTTDGGTNWTLLSGNCEIIDGFNDVYFFNERVGWVVGRNGTIYKTTNGGISFIGEDKNEIIMEEYNLTQNYPNPFNPTTTIKYRIPELSLVTLKVYDVLGNEIAILVNEEKPAGTYEINWNGSKYPSGIYFYRLQAGSFIETKKMVLIK